LPLLSIIVFFDNKKILV